MKISKSRRVEQLKIDVQIFTHSYFGASASETIKLCFPKAKAAQRPLCDVTCTAGAAPGHVTSHSLRSFCKNNMGQSLFCVLTDRNVPSENSVTDQSKVQIFQESNSFRQIEWNISEARVEFLATNFFELLIALLYSTTKDDPIRKWKVAIIHNIAMVFLHDQTNKTLTFCGQPTIEHGVILIFHK